PSYFFFQAEDGIRGGHVTGVQTCALPIYEQRLAPAREVRDVGREADHAGLEPGDGRESQRVHRSQILDLRARPDGLLEQPLHGRSEERRVGKECRCGWWTDR